MAEERTRSHENAIEIPAPPETVWRGITQADEIVRWFSPKAEVKPGLGGSIQVGLPGVEGSSRITVWEPGRHLQLVEERPAGARNPDAAGAVETADPAKPVQIVVDYYLEGKGG